MKLPGIVNVSGLLDLVPYLIPQYTNTTVTFCSANEEPQVKADYAGGFFGEMQSGKVDNSTRTEAYAVLWSGKMSRVNLTPEALPEKLTQGVNGFFKMD